MSSETSVGVLTGGAPVALSGSIEPTRLSLAYRAGLMVVAVAMLLLPLLYLGIIALAGAAVWWHLTSNAWLLSGKGGAQWRLLAYASPAVAGAVVMFFMVKPLLARSAKGTVEPLELTREQEPRLFAFIDEICRQVRAPIPRRVQVDCQVNASAGFLRSRLGVLTSDLVLTIGLPLAAGLSIRELGGVLAHEFGHFAQGGGMRLTGVVRGINGWFARVVYERDEWDEKLTHWSKEADWRLSAVLGLARGAVWASRRVLAGLMWSGHAISCFMMRQMEYDADSYEIKFAGTDAFTRTSARLRELGLATRATYNDLSHGVRRRAVPSNLPVYVTERLSSLPVDVVSQLRQVPEGSTGTFDTHPSDRDRVRAAEAMAAPGVLLGGDASAMELFHHFEALCVDATRHHYEHDLGLEMGALSLIETSDAITTHRKDAAARQAVGDLLGACVSGYRPLRVTLDATQDATALVAASEEARARMRELAGDELASKYRRFDDLERQRADAFTVEALRRSGFTAIDAESFGLTEGTLEEAQSSQAMSLEEQRRLAPALDAFEQQASRRLSSGIQLWEYMARADRSGSTELDREDEAHGSDTAALVDAFNAHSDVMPFISELRKMAAAAAVLEGNTSPDPARATSSLAHLHTAIDDRLRRVHERMKDVSPIGETSSTAARMEQCAETINQVSATYFELLGRLSTMAVRAEAHSGQGPEASQGSTS